MAPVRIARAGGRFAGRIQRLALESKSGRKLGVVRRTGKRNPDNTRQQDPSDDVFNIEKLVKTLPTLPARQQSLITSLLSERGKAQIDELLKSGASKDGFATKVPNDTLVDADFGSTEIDMQQQVHESTADEYLAVCDSLDTMLSLSEESLAGQSAAQSYKTDSDQAEHKEPFDRALWRSVKEFSQLKCPSEVDPPYGLIVRIFELAKLQKGQRRRYRCIKLAGDMLYHYNTVRMDPYNEVEYFDAQAFLGHAKQILPLWESRRSKPDVANSIYWLEVGIIYHQQALQLKRAEKLAQEMETQFGSIQPRVMLGFLHAYMHMSNQAQFQIWADKFGEAVIKNYANTQEESPSDQEQLPKKVPRKERKLNTAQHPLSQSSADKLLNRVNPITVSDIQDAIGISLQANAWESAASLLTTMKEHLNISPEKSDMLRVLDATTKAMFEPQSTRASARLRGEKRKKDVAEKNTRLNNFISQLVAAHPDVLEEPQFYSAWMRGLAGLQLYENARDLLDLLVQRQVPLTPQVLNTLVRAYLSKDKLDMALELLRKMEQGEAHKDGSSTKGVSITEENATRYPSPNASTYALFLQYGARRRDSDFVTTMLDRMNKHHVAHSSASLNTLMYFYYRQKNFGGAFDVYRIARQSNIELSHVNFKTMWLIIRDYYRTFPVSSSSSNTSSTMNNASAPDPNELFRLMVNSAQFRLSLNVYEYALQATLLSGDVEGAAVILCYMETVHNVQAPGLLAISIIQLANKIKKRTAYSFAKPAKHELILPLGQDMDGQRDGQTVAWGVVAQRIADTMEVPLNIEKVQERAQQL